MKITDIITEWSPSAPAEVSDEFIACLEEFTNSYGFELSGENPDRYARIDAAFQAEMPEIRTNYRLYRALALPDWPVLAPSADFVNRNTVEFGHYLSTTKNIDVARAFLGRDILDEKGMTIFVLFSIRAKAGVRAIEVNDYLYRHADDDDGYDEFGDRDFSAGSKMEEEVILHKDAAFRVVSRKQFSGDQWSSPRWLTGHGIDAEGWAVGLEQVK